MDTGYAQVGGRSCVDKIRTLVEGMLGQEGDDLPGSTSDIGQRNEWEGRIKTKYVTISDGY